MNKADQLRAESLKHTQKSGNKLVEIVDKIVSKAETECELSAMQGKRKIVGFVDLFKDTYDGGGVFLNWESPERLLMYIGTSQERAAARKERVEHFHGMDTLIPHWSSTLCERKGLVHDLCLQDVEWVAKSVEQKLQSEGLRAVVEIVKFPDLEHTSFSSISGLTIKIRELPSTYYNIKVSVSW